MNLCKSKFVLPIIMLAVALFGLSAMAGAAASCCKKDAVSLKGFLGFSKRSDMHTDIKTERSPMNNKKKKSLLVVINGESNSGGIANNSDALAEELGVRQSVSILNNRTLEFENLNIGVNNLLEHTGITDVTVLHGWELELANWADKQSLFERPIYLIKTGHGGSKIGEWKTSGSYYTQFVNRIHAGARALKTTDYRTVVLFTLGLNDTLTGTDVNTWKAGVKEHFVNMRRELGAHTPIIMTTFMKEYPIYNQAIEEICREVRDTYCVKTEDATQKDIYHWDYKGMKLITDRMMDLYESLIK